jgi:putative transposase
MPSGLHRTYGAHHLHFITCSCYRRLPFLKTAAARDRFLSSLRTDPPALSFRGRRLRRHAGAHPPSSHRARGGRSFHRDASAEAAHRTGSTTHEQAKGPSPTEFVRGRTATQSVLAGALLRFQRVDDKETRGKAEIYAPQSVKRGLVESPEQWRWSSYRFYFLEEAGPVRVNEGWTEISFRNRVA